MWLDIADDIRREFAEVSRGIAPRSRTPDRGQGPLYTADGWRVKAGKWHVALGAIEAYQCRIRLCTREQAVEDLRRVGKEICPKIASGKYNFWFKYWGEWLVMRASKPRMRVVVDEAIEWEEELPTLVTVLPERDHAY